MRGGARWGMGDQEERRSTVAAVSVALGLLLALGAGLALILMRAADALVGG